MLQSIKSKILKNNKNPKLSLWLALGKSIQNIKSDNECILNERWFLDHFITLNIKYIQAFRLLKKKDFQSAWNQIIDCESIINNLLGNPFIQGLEEVTEDIKNKIEKYQKLFPYKMFASAGYITKEKICNICDTSKLSNNTCKHIKGKVYRGIMCSFIVTEAELKHVALTENPDNRRCILIPQNYSYDYSLLEFLISKLNEPFNNWDFSESIRNYPHSDFYHLDPQKALCPCRSGNIYKDCCLTNSSGVAGKHIEFQIG